MVSPEVATLLKASISADGKEAAIKAVAAWTTEKKSEILLELINSVDLTLILPKPKLIPLKEPTANEKEKDKKFILAVYLAGFIAWLVIWFSRRGRRRILEPRVIVRTNGVRVLPSDGRLGRGLRRRDRIRLQVEGVECFWVHLAGNLQAVANLVTPNSGGRLSALVPGGVTVVKPLIFESLLHGLDRLISAHQTCDAHSNDKMCNCSFHGRRF